MPSTLTLCSCRHCHRLAPANITWISSLRIFQSLVLDLDQFSPQYQWYIITSLWQVSTSRSILYKCHVYFWQPHSSLSNTDTGLMVSRSEPIIILITIFQWRVLLAAILTWHGDVYMNYCVYPAGTITRCLWLLSKYGTLASGEHSIHPCLLLYYTCILQFNMSVCCPSLVEYPDKPTLMTKHSVRILSYTPWAYGLQVCHHSYV